MQTGQFFQTDEELKRLKQNPYEWYKRTSEALIPRSMTNLYFEKVPIVGTTIKQWFNEEGKTHLADGKIVVVNCPTMFVAALTGFTFGCLSVIRHYRTLVVNYHSFRFNVYETKVSDIRLPNIYDPDLSLLVVNNFYCPETRNLPGASLSDQFITGAMEFRLGIRKPTIVTGVDIPETYSGPRFSMRWFSALVREYGVFVLPPKKGKPKVSTLDLS